MSAPVARLYTEPFDPGGADLATVISLILSADVPYFAALQEGGMSHEDIESTIVAQLNDSASDVFPLTIYRVGGDIAGLTTGFSSIETMRRRICSLRHVISRSVQPSHLRNALRQFNDGIPATSDDGWYLARIATNPNFRRKGIGAAMIENFEAYARLRHMRVASLHVAKENHEAIAFYLARAYAVKAIGATHQLMSRAL